MKSPKPTISSKLQAKPQELQIALGLTVLMGCPLECQLRSIGVQFPPTDQRPHLCCAASALLSINGIHTPGAVCGTGPVTFHFLHLTYLMLSFQINEIPV